MEIRVEKWDDGNLLVNAEFAEILRSNSITTAEMLWAISSVPVKKYLRERSTERVCLEPLKIETYIKRYLPLPLKDYIKAYISFKPIFSSGAFHEWDAILAFHKNDLPTVVPIAVGKSGRGSCILTLGITDYTRASELFSKFKLGDKKRKRLLIKKIANLAADMHSANFAHQDFYLVHIFVKEKEDDSIYLLDLQRVIMQKELARRWRIKDLSQLLYSARPYLRNTDIVYFWKIYTEICSCNTLYKNKSFIHAVFTKAEKIKRHSDKKYFSNRL